MKCTQVKTVSPYATGKWKDGLPLYKDEVLCGGEMESVGEIKGKDEMMDAFIMRIPQTLYQCKSCRAVKLQ